MELNGFERAIVAPEDDNAKLKTLDEFKKYGQYKTQGVFQADLQTAKGTTQSNITGLNPTITKVYGSNTTAESEVGVENISCTFAANDMPFDISSLMQGLVRDDTHGGYKRADKRLFKGAYIAISENHGFPVYYAFPYCTFTPGSGVNMQTDAASPVTVHDSFTVTPQARPTDNLLYQIFVGDADRDSAWKDEETMLEYIIDGFQKATTSSTPSSN
ncbi:phage tail protein [Lactobacillus taiwanensis]|uniref:Phage tail protein n=1 Tax=Lactobacillus taiwanensis TaxID=508451 RepID=A0A256LCC7_9LACO|nr:phage tail protein [Lactobacillus taiwanensis]OYR87460.1 phage tail protein [Lactobacillus taiwanensis]OYR91078.1 phage tail protein [Lactobacillus taiwanensis]OYR92540.1 phage tail protein [Lactobacillus taiwanensis]OYR94487.1 phage tail protein [Lactobacillus taiwanensis]